MRCGGYADLCILLAATSQLSVLFGQKILIGFHNGNEFRNATCVETQTLNLYCYFSSCYVLLYCPLMQIMKFIHSFRRFYHQAENAQAGLQAVHPIIPDGQVN